MKMRPCVLTFGLALLVGVFAGCKKKSVEGASGEPAAVTEGAAAPAAASSQAGTVRAALEKKDYDGVVGGLIAMKQSASTPEQMNEFTALVDEVKVKLLDEAPSNPKAAEALATLRRITGGR